MLFLFGSVLTLGACASSTGGPDANTAERERLRNEGSQLFVGDPDSDAGRVFRDPGASDGVPMTQPLSIDGGDPPATSTPRTPVAADRTTSPGSDPDGWSILLERVTGPAHAERARERASFVARAMGRADVRARPVSSGSAVVLGGYTGPDDERAQRDLDFVKSIVSGGVRPYATAILVPPPVSQGENKRFNLVEAAKGMDRAYTHTLQVAVFAGDQAKRRADAERYAQQLRQEGHEAYHFHGRRVSSVTIGAFTSRDFDLDTGVVSARLEQLQETFPHNLYNGEIQRDQVSGEPWNSALVLIPRSG